jgi:hypothetical protein
VRPASHPIVVYGASGYTGKLIAEYLSRRKLPFTAAGRSRERIQIGLKDVPGEHVVEVREVPHEEESLAALFRGARVVINVVGPFGQLGEPVLRASLAAGCHYLDTTGEQDWALLARDRYGKAFADAGLLLSTGCAFMWTAGMIVAELALEDPRVDTLDILYAPSSAPTVASTLSFLRMLCLPNYRKVGGALAEWPPRSVVDVVVPGSHVIHTGLPWGGGFEPLWLQHDPRVRSCQVLVALAKGPLTDWVVGRMHAYAEIAPGKSPQELEALTNQWGSAVASTPPKEIPDVHHALISCHARGRAFGRHLELYVTSPYLQTGSLCAEASKRLLDGRLRATGFQSPTSAFGHRELMAAMAEDGLHCWEQA